MLVFTEFWDLNWKLAYHISIVLQSTMTPSAVWKIILTVPTSLPRTIITMKSANLWLWKQRHSFHYIKYEFDGSKKSHTKNVGIHSTIKHFLSIRDNAKNKLGNGGWLRAGVTAKFQTLPNFFHWIFWCDFLISGERKIMLLLSASNLNTENIKLNVNSIQWRFPYVTVSDLFKLNLLIWPKDTNLFISFLGVENSKIIQFCLKQMRSRGHLGVSQH